MTILEGIQARHAVLRVLPRPWGIVTATLDHDRQPGQSRLRDAIRLISLGRGFRCCRPIVCRHRVGRVYGEKPHRKRGQCDRAQRTDDQGRRHGIWRPPRHKHNPRPGFRWKSRETCARFPGMLESCLAMIEILANLAYRTAGHFAAAAIRGCPRQVM